ncbi:MAG: hypothetical protein MZU95_15485 [Desulfomicrobium escambiense]|nr:hypothetical protein [Desulfomicrobium escambiense]
MCDDWGYEKLHKHFEKRAIDEMKHAEKLIGRILFLEGTPDRSASLNKITIGADRPQAAGQRPRRRDGRHQGLQRGHHPGRRGQGLRHPRHPREDPRTTRTPTSTASRSCRTRSSR